MTNPLNNVPLNTTRVYVMAKTPSGCEVYLPIAAKDITERLVLKNKNNLQAYLNSQSIPRTPTVA